ncbi:hypothetical protein EsDP_00005519 [Epichloe bromicola]|uniref:Cytochrome oxidase complex assembly protein n=1 Tax=Epichloe bromicola TaxID=79588 RepID=A0ABQ0CV19_9HYPO
MLSRLSHRRLISASRPRNICHPPSSSRATTPQRRWSTPAPRPGDGPLMSRRADRQLPEISQVGFRWGRTLPVFVAIVTVCSVAIFNYQKASSPIVSSTLYALRTDGRARAMLGDDIYFRRRIPWIRGQMNQMRGRVDIRFAVGGTRGWATMRFASHRPSARSLFETTEWSLTTEDGTWVDLLEGGDPFRGLLGDHHHIHGPPLSVGGEDEGAAATRGFRQQGALNK